MTLLPPPATTAFVIVDMQNDFVHPDGAYGRAGKTAAAIAALPALHRKLAKAMRAAGGWIVSTHFTLVPGRDGEPFMSPHLKNLRPFLGRGDFAPGSFGHELIADLQPSDLQVEKVAFSAFYQSRMEWMLPRVSIRALILGAIVTNGGVAATCGMRMCAISTPSSWPTAAPPSANRPMRRPSPPWRPFPKSRQSRRWSRR